jgi:hypothetical protein
MKNPETNPISLFFNLISKHYASLIALLLVGTICYFWITERQVPTMLENLTLMVVSFLFGTGFGKGNKNDD